jgi:hypothetical protein
VERDCEDAAERETLRSLVEATLARGNGAERQRGAHRATGSLYGVTRMIVDETAPAKTHGATLAAAD